MRFAIIIALILLNQTAEAQLQDRTEAEPSVDQTAGLVDEDEDLLPQTNYAFNPIQAAKDLKIGAFYSKRGNHRAAAGRFLEATKWNPQYAEAYWRLADARDELKQDAHALDAYRTYLALEPDGKQSRRAKQRVAELEEALKNPPLAAEDAEDETGGEIGDSVAPASVDRQE